MANLIGQTLLNQFRVDSFIASGGMGAVYRVWDLQRNVPLAMKTLHADLADDPSVFKRFQREADALRELAHPNIVPFYGLYRSEEMVFLLQRYVDGPTLKEILRLRHGQPMSVQEALIYLKALSAALGYAHVRGVVHCDVKPANVMIDRGSSIYLTDFGIARNLNSGATSTLAISGTAAYMAPEQVRGQAVSAATDIYALGVLLFEMLAGQRPFRSQDSGSDSGQTANERILAAHLNQPVPDPRSLNPAIPQGLSQVVQKALAKDPAERFSTTQLLFSAACQTVRVGEEAVPDRALLSPEETRLVQEAGAGPTVVARSAPGAVEAPRAAGPASAVPAASMQPTGAPVVPTPARRPMGIYVLGLVVLILLVASIIFFGSGLMQRTTDTGPEVASIAQTQTSIAAAQAVVRQQATQAGLVQASVEAAAAQAAVGKTQTAAALEQSAVTALAVNSQATRLALDATSSAISAQITKAAAQATQSSQATPQATPAATATSQPASASPAAITETSSSLVCGVTSITGKWQGTMVYRGGPITIWIGFTQDNCKVSGIDLNGNLRNSNIVGTIINNKLQLRLPDFDENCPILMYLTVEPDVMDGSLSTCDGGTVNLKRQ